MVKETLEKFERQNGGKKEVIRRKLDIKEMVEKQNNEEEASSVQIICKKLEMEIDLQKEKEFSLKQDIERQKTSKGDKKNSESYVGR